MNLDLSLYFVVLIIVHVFLLDNLQEGICDHLQFITPFIYYHFIQRSNQPLVPSIHLTFHLALYNTLQIHPGTMMIHLYHSNDLSSWLFSFQSGCVIHWMTQPFLSDPYESIYSIPFLLTSHTNEKKSWGDSRAFVCHSVSYVLLANPTDLAQQE